MITFCDDIYMPLDKRALQEVATAEMWQQQISNIFLMEYCIVTDNNTLQKIRLNVAKEGCLSWAEWTDKPN